MEKVDVWIVCYKCGAKKRFVGNPEGTTKCFKCGKTLQVKKCMKVKGRDEPPN